MCFSRNVFLLSIICYYLQKVKYILCASRIKEFKPFLIFPSLFYFFFPLFRCTRNRLSSAKTLSSNAFPRAKFQIQTPSKDPLEEVLTEWLGDPSLGLGGRWSIQTKIFFSTGYLYSRYACFITLGPLLQDR